MEQGDTKLTAEEVAGQQTSTEVATEEVSGQQTSTEVATEEFSGQQTSTEVAAEEVSGQPTSTEIATEEVSGQPTGSETCKLVDNDGCGDVMKLPGKDGNNIESGNSEGCGNDIVSANNEECRAAGEGDPPSEFFDDFFQEEFLEGLDIVDSWVDEENNDGNENETAKSNKESRSQSNRNSDERRDRGRDDRRVRSSTDARRSTYYDRRGRVSDSRKDRTEGDSRDSRRGSQTDRSVPEGSSLDKKDDSRNRRERSSDRRDASRTQRARSPRRERSLENSDLKRTRGERVQERREDNRVHREGSLERKDDNHVRKERSNEKRDDNHVHREKSVEKRDDSRRGRYDRYANSRRYARYRKTPEKRGLEKEDDNLRSNRVIHREKSLEKKPFKERTYDRGNRDRSSDKVSGSAREGERDACEEERRKESGKGEGIDQAKKLDDRQGKSAEHGNKTDANDLSSKQMIDSTGGNKEMSVESNSVQQVTAEKLKMEVSVVSYPHPNLYKKLREENKSEETTGSEGNFFKQFPVIAPNEPVPPGTEDEYVLSEATPKDKSDVTTGKDNVISGVAKQEKMEAVESKVSSSDHTKEGKAKSTDRTALRSVSPKRKKRSRSNSAERARKLRDAEQLKRNEAFNKRLRQTRWTAEDKSKTQVKARTPENNEKSRSNNRDKPSRDLGRRNRRSLGHEEKSGTSRERSRERLGKRERSIERRLMDKAVERFGNREKPFEGDLKHNTSAEGQKIAPRPLSPAIYERFSSPSLSLELSPVSSVRERSLSRSVSRERYKRRRHRSRRNSLSPISLSDTSLSLSSESEYERKKRNYNRSRQRKPPFLKELAEILAADSAKRRSYPTPPPAYVDGPQNNPHLEMVPPDVVYPPAPVDHPMQGYPPPMFQPGGVVPAEEYPPEAYAQHLPPDVPQPYMPHMHPHPAEVPPPTDFVFSLPHPHPGVPHGVPMSAPLPVGDPNMFQFQVGHIPPEMNPPNIHPGHPYPPEAYHGGDPFSVPQNPHALLENNQAVSHAPPPPMLSDTMPHSGKKLSLSSVLEASAKVSKQQIGSEREAVIQRCEKAIRILKADEHLVTGGCFTFLPVASQNVGLDNQANGPHAYLSPLLSGKNLIFSFTKPPEPKKQPATAKKTVLNAVRSLLAERGHPVPEPPKPCERCLENSKKTFVDSSVQTNEVVLCSVATQSDYQSFSESDFRRFDVQNRVQSDMFHGPNRGRIGSEFQDQPFSRMMMREYLPLDIKHGRPSDFNQSMNFPSNLPFRDLARNDVLPESRSINMSPPRREPMPFDPRSSDFLDTPNLSRPARSSSGPFSGLPLKGILKSSRQSTSEMFPARPEQDIPAHKSKDVWSRLGPLSSSGHPYGSDPEPLAQSGGPDNPDLSNRFSSLPSGMTREEYQRYFMGLPNQQRSDRFGPVFNSSGSYSQTR